MYVCVRTHATVHRACAEVRGQFKDLILSFHHHVGLRDEAEISRLGSQHLYQQNHLTTPLFCFRQKSHYLDQGKLEFKIHLPLFPEF